MKLLTFIELLAEDPPKGNITQTFIMIGLMIVVFWIVVIRPNQKRQKEMKEKTEALKKGDKVITIGGLHGVVNSVSEKTISLKVGDAQFLTFNKQAVATVEKKKGEEAKADKK